MSDRKAPAPIRRTRAFANLSWGQMHFEEQGHGEPLLLLHPTGLSSRGYHKVMDHIAHYRVLAPDLPGCGFSDALPADLAAQPSMHAFANVLVEFLDTVGIDKAHVFGAHLGNKLGAALASGHPARVASCFFTGHTHSFVLDADTRQIAFPNGDALRKWAAGGLGTHQSWNALLNEAMALGQVDPGSAGAPPAHRLEQAYDEVVCRLLGMSAYGPLYSANFSFDFKSAARRISCPVHILELAVAEDAALGRQAPLWERSLAACTSDEVEIDLRSLLYAQPGALATRLAAFLASLKGQASNLPQTDSCSGFRGGA